MAVDALGELFELVEGVALGSLPSYRPLGAMTIAIRRSSRRAELGEGQRLQERSIGTRG
jgi:hypothetical protein